MGFGIDKPCMSCRNCAMPHDRRTCANVMGPRKSRSQRSGLVIVACRGESGDAGDDRSGLLTSGPIAEQAGRGGSRPFARSPM